MNDMNEEQLCALQMEMRSKINHTAHVGNVQYVGGADLTVEGDLMVGCFVVVDITKNSEAIYEKCMELHVDVPYIPGLLCFREGPVVLTLFEDFKAAYPDIKLDILLVDGSGEWHPRGFGLACYVGLETGIPTIGVSKSFLNVGSDHRGKEVQIESQTQCPNKGDVMIIHHDLNDGYHIDCGVLRTTDSMPFKPIFVSPGHLIDIESSIRIVREMCHYREPEPLRLADRVSRQYVREKHQIPNPKKK